VRVTGPAIQAAQGLPSLQAAIFDRRHQQRQRPAIALQQPFSQLVG